MGNWIGRPIDEPLQIIRDYDLVWGSGLTAIEAAACGAAVIVGDGRGLAGMLKSSNFNQFRRFNFGLDLLVRALTADLIGEEIDAYDAEDADKVSRLALEDARLDRQLENLELVFSEAIDLLSQVKPTEDEINRALSSYLARHLPRAVEGEDSPRLQRFHAADEWSAAISSLEDRTTDIAARLAEVEGALAPMISFAASVDRNRPALALLRPFARAVRFLASGRAGRRGANPRA